MLWNKARYAEAEQEFRQLLDVARRGWGPDCPKALAAMSNLALTVQAQGRFAEAEPLYREALAASQRVLGPEHYNTALMTGNLGDLLASEGRLAEAEKLYREALGIWLRTLGPDHAGTLMSQANLADVNQPPAPDQCQRIFREGLNRVGSRRQETFLPFSLKFFHATEKLVEKQPWYQGGYRASTAIRSSAKCLGNNW